MLTSPSRYNAMSHPLPFMKASSVVAPKKSAKDVPDLEEAIEEEAAEEDPEPVDEDELDLKKDKYVQQPKKRKPAAPKGKQATKAANDDDDADDIAPPKPAKKARAKK